jgi:hypothetical protein
MENFEFGIRRYQEGEIIIIESEGNMSRNALDVWTDVVLTSIPQVKDTAYYLIDLSHPNQGITPYSSSKTQEIMEAIPPEMPVYAAVVLRESILTQMIIRILRPYFRNLKNMDMRFFVSREQAMVWLRTRQKG